LIIVRLEGGLGNQMFQYATAKHLSLIQHTDLKVDPSAFNKTIYKESATWRGFQLSVFKLNVDTATDEEMKTVKNSTPDFFEQLKYRLLRVKTVPYYRKNELYESTPFRFDSNILKAGKNTHLTGYWQSPNYFEAIRQNLLNEFTLREKPDKNTYPLIDQLQQQNSVSIHIRRGDYVSNPEYLKIHGLCSLEYYRAAIDYICSKVTYPVFYFFSDDMQWVKENLKTEYPAVYVSGTPEGKDHYEMHLMSLCKHNIIANSSFSWWGAWLNRNEHKTVIAPKQWMGDAGIDTTDLIPENWVRL
jgi:hypothetical protein